MTTPPTPKVSPMHGEYTTAEIVRSLNRIEEKVDGLAAGYVPRTEWNLWANARDREIRDLKQARAPWWTWATILIALGSFALAVIPKLAQ